MFSGIFARDNLYVDDMVSLVLSKTLKFNLAVIGI